GSSRARPRAPPQARSSRRRQPPARATTRRGVRGGARLVERSVGECGERIEAAGRPSLARRGFGSFPTALQQAHFLEAPERAIQRAVCSEQTAARRIAEGSGDLVAVEGVLAAAAKQDGGFADGYLQRDEGARFAAHGGNNRQISALVNA